MGRFSPTVLPQSYQPDPGLILEGLLLYRDLKRQDKLDQFETERQRREAEKYDIDLYERGYRRGRAPATEDEVEGRGALDYGGIGLQRPPAGTEDDDSFGRALANMRFRPDSPTRGTAAPLPGEPEQEQPAFVPGQYIPGLGFKADWRTILTPGINPNAPDHRDMLVPRRPNRDPRDPDKRWTPGIRYDPELDDRIGMQRPPTARVQDPGFEQITEGIYRARARTPGSAGAGLTPEQDRLRQLLVARGMDQESAELGARRPDLIDNLFPSRTGTRTTAVGGGLDLTARQLVAAGLTEAEAAIALADPTQLDNLLTRAGRPKAKGGTTTGRETLAQARNRILDDAKAIARTYQGIGREINDVQFQAQLASALAKRHDITIAQANAVASRAAQEVRIERTQPVGSPGRPWWEELEEEDESGAAAISTSDAEIQQARELIRGIDPSRARRILREEGFTDFDIDLILGR